MSPEQDYKNSPLEPLRSVQMFKDKCEKLEFLLVISKYSAIYIYMIPFKPFPSCSGAKTVNICEVDTSRIVTTKLQKEFCVGCRTILIVSCHQINSLILQGNQYLCEQWEDGVCHEHRLRAQGHI